MSTVSHSIAITLLIGDGVYGGLDEEAPDNPRYHSIWYYFNTTFTGHNYKLVLHPEGVTDLLISPHTSQMELLWSAAEGIKPAGRELLKGVEAFETMRTPVWMQGRTDR